MCCVARQENSTCYLDKLSIWVETMLIKLKYDFFIWESKYNLLIGPKYSSQHCYSLSLELDHLALYITLLVVSINTAVEIYVDLTLP